MREQSEVSDRSKLTETWVLEPWPIFYPFLSLANYQIQTQDKLREAASEEKQDVTFIQIVLRAFNAY